MLNEKHQKVVLEEGEEEDAVVVEEGVVETEVVEEVAVVVVSTEEAVIHVMGIGIVQNVKTKISLVVLSVIDVVKAAPEVAVEEEDIAVEAMAVMAEEVVVIVVIAQEGKYYCWEILNVHTHNNAVKPHLRKKRP